MSNPIRILLADDHTVLRQGMAQALNMQPDMTVVAQASNGVEAVQLVQACQPDVALLDIHMPEMDGVEATRQITAAAPQTAVIILTMYRRDDYVLAAIQAGASGYLLKEVELDELLAAIRAVAQGDAVMDPAIAGRVLDALRRPPGKNRAQPPHPDFPQTRRGKPCPGHRLRPPERAAGYVKG